MFLDLSLELLRDGYGVRFRPGGHSMHPTIRDGEPVTVAPVKPQDVLCGDIILYRTQRGNVIAHRVLMIEKAVSGELVFQLRGDAATSADAPVSEAQILGKLIEVERNGRRRNLSEERQGAKLWRHRRAGLARLRAAARARLLKGLLV